MYNSKGRLNKLSSQTGRADTPPPRCAGPSWQHVSHGRNSLHFSTISPVEVTVCRLLWLNHHSYKESKTLCDGWGTF